MFSMDAKKSTDIAESVCEKNVRILLKISVPEFRPAHRNFRPAPSNPRKKLITRAFYPQPRLSPAPAPSTRDRYPRQIVYPSNYIRLSHNPACKATSKRHRNNVKACRRIDVQKWLKWTSLRRRNIDVVSTFSTSYQRRITVENAHGIDVKMLTSFRHTCFDLNSTPKRTRLPS